VGTALPKNITIFIIYRIIGGLGVGAASMSSPMYIAEISPAKIRGRMVSVNQFAIVTGFLVVYFVNYFIALQGDQMWNQESGWRWMFGSEALPALLLLVLLFFVPESPRWLTKQNRSDEALEILACVNGAEYAKTELLEIKDALAHESGSLKQLFQPGMKIVLVIGIVLAVLQQVTGINVFLYFGTEIFKKMGSDTNAALLQTVIVGVVNLTFTIIAIWLVDRLGRKPLMMIGSVGMGLSLLGMGLMAYVQKTDLWVLLFILSYIACFALSVGPVTWVILSEIFPTRIRGRAMAIATVCLWVANYLVSQTFPMMEENNWLLEKFHHAFPFWLYGIFCVVLVTFVWRFVPETKGKTLEEIEKHWMST
jgi:SP family xylose:H+ symportor-like MFS transporter